MKFSYYLVIIFFILSCNYMEGKPGMSQNVKESKRRKVFVCEYVWNKEKLNFDGKFKLHIQVAWLEKKWAYSAQAENSIMLPGYQLVVLTREELDDNYSFTWTIGTDFKRNFRRCGNSCIMTDFDFLPKDIETWEIQQGRTFSTSVPKKIIGNFSLMKKL